MTTLLLTALLLAGGTEAGPDPELVGGREGTLVDASSRVLFGMQWRRPIVRTGLSRTVNQSFGRPVVSERCRCVVVGSGEGIVRGLSLDDGTELWSRAYRAPFESGATLAVLGSGAGASELVLIGARDGVLLALDTGTGQERWHLDVGGDMRAPAHVVGARAYLATASSKVVAIDIDAGKALWSKSRPAPTGLTVMGHSRPAVGGGLVYAAFADGYVEAYVAETGEAKWSRPLSLSGGEFIDADADPLVAGEVLVVASYSDGVYGLRRDTGATIWQRSAPSVVSLADATTDPARRVVMAGSADGWVWGLDVVDGKLLYRTRLPQGAVSRIAVRDGLALLTGGNADLFVLSTVDGKPLQATALGGLGAGDPAWGTEHVAVLASTGYLYTLKRGGPAVLR